MVYLKKVLYFKVYVKGGYSLTELVLATFLLVTALLAIAGVFFSGTTAIKKGTLTAQATDIAYNEKVFLELYDFNALTQGLTPNTTCVPGNTFFSRYPKQIGNYKIQCSECFYRDNGSLKLLYVKLRVSNVPEVNKAASTGRNRVDVSLDVLISPNKN